MKARWRTPAGQSVDRIIQTILPATARITIAGFTCVYRKLHTATISVLAGEIPCSCAKISCSVEKIPYSVA
jgi:hypothetical protein